MQISFLSPATEMQGVFLFFFMHPAILFFPFSDSGEKTLLGFSAERGILRGWSFILPCDLAACAVDLNGTGKSMRLGCETLSYAYHGK